MTVLLNQSSSGAPTLSGTIGALAAVLDWALVQAGWTILYSSSNARIYETVNGLLLHINDDNAQFCTVRGVEAAAGATSFTDPYPTVAQHAVSVWRKSSLSSGAAINFDIAITDDCVVLVTEYSASSMISDLGVFGRPVTPYDDTFASLLVSRKTTSASSSFDSMSAMESSTEGGGGTEIYWMRDVTGATKSTTGKLYLSGSRLGVVSGMPVARGGYQNMIVREPVAVNDSGSVSVTSGVLALSRRGYIPHLWSGVHNGPDTLTPANTFEDSAYNPGAEFKPFFGIVSGGIKGWAIFETTDTWDPFG